MVTVEIPAKLTVDDLVKAVEQLPAQELTKFIRRVVALQARRGGSLLVDEEEQALLTVVETRLPSELQSRLDTLREEGRRRALTPSEQAELLQFVQQVEQQDLRRAEALIELARKRGISISTLLAELGLAANYA
jgi:hypothetical protein